MVAIGDFIRLAGFAVCAGLLSPVPALAQTMEVVHRIEAEHARQGVASDGRNIYAVDNSAITRIAISSGKVTGEWTGDPEKFPHLNSCTVVSSELVCAASNYPALPQLSTIEVFDLYALRHKRSISLGALPGSLTTLERHDGAWWATFANYDDRGTPAGRNHRDTFLARLNEDFMIDRLWGLPAPVLDLLAPKSISGASWGQNGLLYLSGHDKPEIYAMKLPEAGPVLDHVGTFSISTNGQAIDVDPKDPGLLWSIDRKSKVVVGSRLSPSN